MKIFVLVAAASAALNPLISIFSEDVPATSVQIEENANNTQAVASIDQNPVMVSRPVVQPLPPVIEEDTHEDVDAAYHASAREIECLVSVVHHEARGEPVEGRVAVVEVVLARRDSNSFPKTACGVIAQPSQFSFVKRGYIPPVSGSSYKAAKAVVMDVLSGRTKSSARGAMYFHATYVNPSWTNRMRKISRIGRHMFYGT